jgi:hypothetical protein
MFGNKVVVLLRDGFGTFTINFPHQGAVTLIKALDYEKGEGFKKVHTIFPELVVLKTVKKSGLFIVGTLTRAFTCRH